MHAIVRNRDFYYSLILVRERRLDKKTGARKKHPRKQKIHLRRLLSHKGCHKVLLPALLPFSQIMPQEPRVVGDVRSLLDETRGTLKKMMPQREFFEFLSSRALPDLEKQVGKHVLEVLHTIVRVLHIQCEVSQVTGLHEHTM